MKTQDKKIRIYEKHAVLLGAAAILLTLTSGCALLRVGADADREAAAARSEQAVEEQVKDQTRAVPAGKTMYVSGDSLYVRSSAKADPANIIGNLHRGDAVTVIGGGGEWFQVSCQGKAAFVSSRYLAADPKSAETSPAAEPGAGEGSSGADGTKESEGGVSTVKGTAIPFDTDWQYGDHSAIHSGSATLYRAPGERRGITVAVNAGHGCSGGEKVKTLSHPDGSPKVTGGTNGAGAVKSMAISGGMTFQDGTSEAAVNLKMAKKLKEVLLAAGYDVLMLRESDDQQLDNVARTVMANQYADCHIAIHWDSTESDKGAFFMSVPDGSYKQMEPVSSHWQQHEKLGNALISGLKGQGVKIFSGGSMDTDLTQTAYSTIPSVDIELGDKASDHSEDTISTLANGLREGVNRYFGQ